MIGKLTGLVDSTGVDWAILDVAGVGYLVYCSARTLGRIAEAREAVSLAIETHVREDHIHLYGFADATEREWFRLLGTVQGVGSRVALAVLSALPAEELIQAIAAQDRVPLTRASGVGPKLAQRIVSELKDKVGALELARHPAAAAAGRLRAAAGGPLDDAVSALVNLGYRRTEAFGAIAQAASRLGGEPALEALIKEGLRELSA